MPEARELQYITSHEKVHYLLQNHIGGRSMFVKNSGDPPIEAENRGFNENNVLVVENRKLHLAMDQEVTLFRILGRYMELNCVVTAMPEHGIYHLHIKTAGISPRERGSTRIPVNPDVVAITNIRASKHAIDASLFSIPTTVKVSFADYERKLKGSNDFVKIDVYGARGTVLDEIRKTNRTLFVPDTQDPACYKALSPFYLDYDSILFDGVPKRMMEYKREKVVSEIIVPVTYITHDMTSIPLGYIHMQSKTQSQKYTEDKVLELQQLAFEMVDRIRDSNTVIMTHRETVLNLSRGGLKVMIKHPELKEYLKRQGGCTFDVLFRMQGPITLFGKFRSSIVDHDGNLLLGIQISGTSSRENEMKRYMDNISQLETKLAAALDKRRAEIQKQIAAQKPPSAQ
jgi:hypothetical protein